MKKSLRNAIIVLLGLYVANGYASERKFTIPAPEFPFPKLSLESYGRATEWAVRKNQSENPRPKLPPKSQSVKNMIYRGQVNPKKMAPAPNERNAEKVVTSWTSGTPQKEKSPRDATSPLASPRISPLTSPIGSPRSLRIKSNKSPRDAQSPRENKKIGNSQEKTQNQEITMKVYDLTLPVGQKEQRVGQEKRVSFMEPITRQRSSSLPEKSSSDEKLHSNEENLTIALSPRSEDLVKYKEKLVDLIDNFRRALLQDLEKRKNLLERKKKKSIMKRKRKKIETGLEVINVDRENVYKIISDVTGLSIRALQLPQFRLAGIIGYKLENTTFFKNTQRLFSMIKYNRKQLAKKGNKQETEVSPLPAQQTFKMRKQKLENVENLQTVKDKKISPPTFSPRDDAYVKYTQKMMNLIGCFDDILKQNVDKEKVYSIMSDITGFSIHALQSKESLENTVLSELEKNKQLFKNTKKVSLIIGHNRRERLAGDSENEKKIVAKQ